ncbi:MAG: glycerophosphodiester phosphodiesterase [Promethearchaeota archaeon]
MTDLRVPAVYGHRGAMGYCIENTIPCFKKAVNMGAGIESDVQLTGDNVLICFHDYFIKFNSNSHDIKKLTYEKLRSIKFKDKRTIPTVHDLFTTFNQSYRHLLFSFDIRDKNSGFEIIKVAEFFDKLNQITITDMRPNILKCVREFNEEVKLVHTIPTWVIKVNQSSINFEKLKDLDVQALNIRIGRRIKDNFKEIINNGFKCYIWGVNSKSQMKNALNLKYSDEVVTAIYTDYPDILIKLRKKFYF